MAAVHHCMQQQEVAGHLLSRGYPVYAWPPLASSMLTQEGAWSQKRSCLIKYETPSVYDT
jgi:hypothetical protein